MYMLLLFIGDLNMDVMTQNPWITPQPLIKRSYEKDLHLESLAEKVAVSELRENQQTREECLKQLKEWIKQNHDIENCITGNVNEKLIRNPDLALFVILMSL